MLPPLNRFSTAAFSRLYRAASRASETMFNISSDRTHSPFRSLTFLPNVAIESNWKPMSECVKCLYIITFCNDAPDFPVRSSDGTEPNSGRSFGIFGSGFLARLAWISCAPAQAQDLACWINGTAGGTSLSNCIHEGNFIHRPESRILRRATPSGKDRIHALIHG